MVCGEVCAPVSPDNAITSAAAAATCLIRSRSPNVFIGPSASQRFDGMELRGPARGLHPEDEADHAGEQDGPHDRRPRERRGPSQEARGGGRAAPPPPPPPHAPPPR